MQAQMCKCTRTSQKNWKNFPKKVFGWGGEGIRFFFLYFAAAAEYLKKKKSTVASQLPFQTFGPEQLLQRIVKCNRHVGM